MKYQTEYGRSYQNRIPRKAHELSAEERKLNEVPFQRTSPSRRRGRSLPDRNNLDENFAVIGPNDKFSKSQFYRLKEPVKDYPRVRKSREYALLGRNEKFENNIAYPLRQPVTSDSPRVIRRRRKRENHSCGIQTELSNRHRRETDRNRKRIAPQSEYKDRFIWTTPSKNQTFIEDTKSRERRSDPQISTSVAVNTPARVEIDVNKTRPQANRTVTTPAKGFRSKRDETTEYRARYKPVINPKKPRIRKAFEAEQIDERKRKEIEKPERAYSDDEGINGNVDLGDEFRQKYPYGKLRRWKSEYQATYKPFWRFDYKNGKWYKDTAADEKGFNPDLFWYKELMSTRKRADEYRAKAETDHFNRDHTLQLQTGFNLNNNDRAWDTDYDDDDDDSVISIDRDLEKERIEGERRREIDAQRIAPKKEKSYEKPSAFKTDQVSQTEHQVDRVVYIDDPPPKQPSAATKAFVRNLGSSSVQQHMSWDSDSLVSQRTNSDLGSHRKYQNNIIRRTSSKKTGTQSPPTSERQQRKPNNGYMSPKINQVPRTIDEKEANSTTIRPSTSYHETSQATGRPSYDTHAFDKRPYTNTNEYCTYPGSRFKDEVTEYYYASDDNRRTPISKPSFPSDERYGQKHNTHNKDDDVLSVNSSRSLSSSCSLASQTLERAQQNMNKYWGEHPPSSSTKPFSTKH